MELYYKMQEQKKNGVVFNIKELNEKLLSILWKDENASDSAIAELYDVPKYRITSLRRKYDLTFQNLVFEKFLTELSKENK